MTPSDFCTAGQKVYFNMLQNHSIKHVDVSTVHHVFLEFNVTDSGVICTEKAAVLSLTLFQCDRCDNRGAALCIVLWSIF